jgi:hypothetical protein
LRVEGPLGQLHADLGQPSEHAKPALGEDDGRIIVSEALRLGSNVRHDSQIAYRNLHVKRLWPTFFEKVMQPANSYSRSAKHLSRRGEGGPADPAKAGAVGG